MFTCLIPGCCCFAGAHVVLLQVVGIDICGTTTVK
jgi:hypothetical protein